VQKTKQFIKKQSNLSGGSPEEMTRLSCHFIEVSQVSNKIELLHSSCKVTKILDWKVTFCRRNA
jgi:hypothetical protein